jgi:hypothetical protein
MGLFDWLKARPKPIPPVRLTVFCTEELLPCPLQIAHPDGLLGALVGIPRASDGDPQSRLPLETSMVVGSYAFSGVSGTVSARVSKRCPGEAYPGCDAAGTDFRGLGEAERSWLAGSLWAVRFEVSEVNSGETEVCYTWRRPPTGSECWHRAWCWTRWRAATTSPASGSFIPEAWKV